VGGAHEIVEPERHQLGEEQVEPCVVAVEAGARRPRGDRSGAHRVEARDRARRSTLEALDPLGVQDPPHRRHRDRRPLADERRRDLGDRTLNGIA